jgi:hypothetical protein
MAAPTGIKAKVLTRVERMTGRCPDGTEHGSRARTVLTRVRLHRAVHGDGPFWRTAVGPGEHACECNAYGAVSVRASNGEMLGLRLNEFEVLEEGPNPHWRRECR